jgi:predicted nucleic acid-binding protein
VSYVIVLDSGPLGLITHPRYGSAEVVEATDWISQSIFAGTRVIVPAIVYYELKRELLRARKNVGLSRLDEFVNATPDRYLPLSDEALRLAADLWARSRQMGRLTADPKDLDIDVIIAGPLHWCRCLRSRSRDHESETPVAVRNRQALERNRCLKKRERGASFGDALVG